MSVSIASVTVAYNAGRPLPRQLDALLRQTRPLQEIVVVDNGSIDGTAELLAERYPQVTVLRMPENLGAAGGWAAGLSYAALEMRHDWVWSFDDDSVANDDALEALLKGVELVSDTDGPVGIAAALPVNRSTGTSYPPVLWRNGFVNMSAEALRERIWLADLVVASGCMVRRDMVERIGLPRADFFMDVFDFEYCIRARSEGYRIAVITAAQFSHEIGNTRKITLPGYSREWMNQAPWREYYISRNLAFLAWWLYPNRGTKRSIARYLAIHAAQVLLFSSHKLACLTKMAQGCLDARRGILGIRFRPGDTWVRRVDRPVNTLKNTRGERA